MNGSRIADEYLAEEMGVDYDVHTSEPILLTREDFEVDKFEYDEDIKKMNLKLNVDDTVRIKLKDDVFKIVLITCVNQTTINTVDVNENKETFFIKEVVKVITKQKKLPLEFEEKSNLKQLTLF